MYIPFYSRGKSCLLPRYGMAKVMEKEIKKLAQRIEDHEKRIKELENLTKTKETKKKGITMAEDVDVVEKFQLLDLTEFSYVYKLKGLPLFLAIISIAKEKLVIDGLAPGEVSRICKEKIRVSRGTQSSNISLALSQAGAKVDRIDNPRGSGYIYRIMRDGEIFLQQAIEKV